MIEDIHDYWSYDKVARFDNKGDRWHFLWRNIIDRGLPHEDQSVEIYFRNDAKTKYGVLKFSKRKDNPFRNYITMINKLMNDSEFRKTLLEPETKSVWRKNWK